MQVRTSRRLRGSAATLSAAASMRSASCGRTRAGMAPGLRGALIAQLILQRCTGRQVQVGSSCKAIDLCWPAVSTLRSRQMGQMRKCGGAQSPPVSS